MAWVHNDILDGGLLALKNNAVKIALLRAYANADSFATVNGNTIAAATIAAADLTISTDGTKRKCQLAAGKTGQATASTVDGTDLFIAFLAADRVLCVVDETSNQAITTGNPVNFPAAFYRSGQPV